MCIQPKGCPHPPDQNTRSYSDSMQANAAVLNSWYQGTTSEITGAADYLGSGITMLSTTAGSQNTHTMALSHTLTELDTLSLIQVIR